MLSGHGPAPAQPAAPAAPVPAARRHRWRGAWAGTPATGRPRPAATAWNSRAAGCGGNLHPGPAGSHVGFRAPLLQRCRRPCGATALQRRWWVTR
ncbi:hypothetical protein C8245_20650 [Paracidovorax avenae]|nr:hypothetical protein C8245_20650 [Paracidovorax avenae]